MLVLTLNHVSKMSCIKSQVRFLRIFNRSGLDFFKENMYLKKYELKQNYYGPQQPNVHIKMTSYEDHGISNHRKLDHLSNRIFSSTKNKHRSSHYGHFVRRNLRWPDSHHQGPVMRKAFPCMSWYLFIHVQGFQNNYIRYIPENKHIVLLRCDFGGIVI